MTDDLDRRAHAILKAAVDVEPDARPAFVASACGDDGTLRARVDALVAALEGTRSFLEASALAPGAPAATDTIDGYTIESVIGRGGMATVYLAQQERPRRRVALKVMSQALAGTSALRRFEFETEVLAQLRHPGIAQIYEVGASAGGDGSIPWFAMEHVPDARSLTEYADQAGLDLRARLALFAEVCDAVHHGHQNGVIHRDLKPSNILVDGDGNPKVIDFGIARSIDSNREGVTQHTHVGQIVGTLNYMSPEQCSADSRGLDVRTDVYSLGVTLYELLCGQLPHALTGVPVPEALRRIQEDRPARPATVDESLRGDVDAIIGKAMALEPDRRYRSANELATDIRRHLRHESIVARPPTALYQLTLFARRNRTLVTAAALVALAMLVGTIVSTSSALRASDAERRALEERDEARWNEYVATIEAAQGANDSGEPIRLRRRLDAAPDEHRNWEWRHLDALATAKVAATLGFEARLTALAVGRTGGLLAAGFADGSVRVWRGQADGDLEPVCTIDAHEGRVSCIAVDEATARVLTGGRDGASRVWRADTGARVAELDAGGRVFGVALDSAGLAATVGEAGGWIWDAANGASLAEIDHHAGLLPGVRFSPSGALYATWGGKGVSIANVSDPGQARPLEIREAVTAAAFSPDGALIAISGASGAVTVWRVETLEPVHALPVTASRVTTLAFSSDSARLAVGRINRAVAIWSMETGTQVGLLQGHADGLTGAGFGAGDERLYSGALDRTLRVWDVTDPGPVLTLAGHRTSVNAACFSPDGTLVASAARDGAVRFWDPVLGTSLGKVGGRAAMIFDIAFTRDGRHVVTACYDKVLRVRDGRTGAVVHKVPHPDAVTIIESSSDGRFLVTGCGDGVARVVDPVTLEIVHELRGHDANIESVAISADSALIATGSVDQTIRLWDPRTGADLGVVGRHDSSVSALVFAPAGRLLYSGSRDQTVRTWDTATRALLDVFDDHGQHVTGLAISPDGSRLAASSWFEQIVAWDLATGDAVISFTGHDDAIRSIAFDQAGRRILTASQDNQVRIWDSAPTPQRRAERAHARQAYELARTIVAALFEEHGAAVAVADAIDTDPRVTDDLHPWVAKALLERAAAAK